MTDFILRCVALIIAHFNIAGSDRAAIGYGLEENQPKLYTVKMGNRKEPLVREIGAYAGGRASDTNRYAEFLGIPLAFCESHTGRASVSDFTGSISYMLNENPCMEKAIAMPMFWSGADLASAASGAYDTQYRTNANQILTSIPNQKHIWVRSGWEFNHSFQPWGIIDQSGTVYTQNADKAFNYASTFRRIVSIFREAEQAFGRPGTFQFIWNMNIGSFDPEPAWPGTQYVDAIGIDFYTRIQDGQPVDPAENFAYQRLRPFGLDYFIGLAKKFNKSAMVNEFGVKEDNWGCYFKAENQWELNNQISRSSYWDSNGDYPSQVSTGLLPINGAWMRRIYNPTIYKVDPDYSRCD